MQNRSSRLYVNSYCCRLLSVDSRETASSHFPSQLAHCVTAEITDKSDTSIYHKASSITKLINQRDQLLFTIYIYIGFISSYISLSSNHSYRYHLFRTIIPPPLTKLNEHAYTQQQIVQNRQEKSCAYPAQWTTRQSLASLINCYCFR
jgi:hypothetical protein